MPQMGHEHLYIGAPHNDIIPLRVLCIDRARGVVRNCIADYRDGPVAGAMHRVAEDLVILERTGCYPCRPVAEGIQSDKVQGQLASAQRMKRIGNHAVSALKHIIGARPDGNESSADTLDPLCDATAKALRAANRRRSAALAPGAAALHAPVGMKDG